MGLDFHCRNGKTKTAQWAYHGFNSFRRRLAREVDIDLDVMQGFGGELPWKNIKDPIKYFLNHSDCDGQLSPLKCSLIAPRIESLIKTWHDGDYDKESAKFLIANMKECIKLNTPLIFC